MTEETKQCYCEQVLTSDRMESHDKVVCIDAKFHDWTRTRSALYIDYNVNNGKYALFAEANGDGRVGCYVGISYCPFCGRDFRKGRKS